MMKVWQKNYLTICAILLSVSAISEPGSAQDVFEVDNAHSSILFSVSHFNIGYIYGRFNKCSGLVNMNKEEPNKSTFEFELETQSIDTNDIGRDNHLKGDDFFDVENHAVIQFKSSTVRVDRGNYKVTGTIKLLGVEKEITIPFQLLGVGKGPFGNTRMGMIGKFSIKRSDFGMDEMIDSIGDDVAITFSFQGILK